MYLPYALRYLILKMIYRYMYINHKTPTTYYKFKYISVFFQFLIQTRNRAVVSVAAGNPDLEDQHGRQGKERPSSAPVTRLESDSAQLSAGETGRYVARAEERARPKTAKPRLVQQIEEELREEREGEGVGGDHFDEGCFRDDDDDDGDYVWCRW